MIFCTKSNQNSFPFILPELPYDKGDFVPYFTSETFNYHHGKHHKAYVNNLNKLLENDREFSGKNLEEIIIASVNLKPGIFNNAAQIWNHSFFWHSIKPGGGGKPSGILFNKITKDFGSYENFVTEFKQAATTQFGSGWAWLVHNDNKLQIIKTGNAIKKYNNDKQMRNFLDITRTMGSKERVGHPTQKKIETHLILVEMLSNKGEIVLDPFLGSGTTACACIITNRNYIGFELNYEFYLKASARVASCKINNKCNAYSD